MIISIHEIDILGCLRRICFIILLAWISFFPEPLQVQYRAYIWVFLSAFLLILISDKGRNNHIFSLRDWPLWVFLAGLLSGIACAVDRAGALRTYWYLAITLFFLFYIGKSLFLYAGDKEFVAVVVCIFSGLVALLGIFEAVFAFNPLYAYFINNPYYERYISGVARPMSTQYNPAPLATYLLLSLPFAAYAFRQGRQPVRRALVCVVMVLNIVCLVLTFCRSSFLGLVIMIFLYLYLKKKRRAFGMAFLLCAIFMSLAFLLPYPSNRISFKGISTAAEGIASEYRMDRLVMAVRMLKDKPFFGVGFNHFRILFDRYYPGKMPFIPEEVKIADNMYLTLLAETGLTGFAGFLLFSFFLFKRAYRYPVFFSALAGFFVSMAGYELFYWSNPYMFFCLMSGFCYPEA